MPDDAALRPKYVQIRPDQWTDLDELARELQDAKSKGGQRITANTVIRIAIDLILTKAALLSGDTEEEIRQNLLEQIG